MRGLPAAQPGSVRFHTIQFNNIRHPAKAVGRILRRSGAKWKIRAKGGTIVTPEQWLSMPELDGTVAHGSLEAGDVVIKQPNNIELAGAFFTASQKKDEVLRCSTLYGFTT